MEEIDGEPVTSSRIRQEITQGNVAYAQKLLGRPYNFSGYVVRHFNRGSTRLGFPTANITYPNTILPKKGVYAVRILYNKTCYLGVMNIGTNPTFTNNSTKDTTMPYSIEVHILNFSETIYGAYLTIECLEYIREERKFSTLEALIQQIQHDIAYVLTHYTV